MKSRKNARKETLDVFRKFTYQTRISSRYFCEALCEHFKELRNSKEIRKDIVSKTWFMSEWEQDPTVKAMLNMLGGTKQSIESIFGNCTEKDLQYYWSVLTNSENCPIVFYYLPIDGDVLQDPDDIYIKMNARGEHLTDFENFKADLIKYVRNNKDKWIRFGVEHPELNLSTLIDVNWTNVFWNNLTEEQKKATDPLPSVDMQFFAFLNRYFLNRILSTTQLSADSLTGKMEVEAQMFQYLYGKKGDADINLIYKDFQLYEKCGAITPEVFNDLKIIFEILKDNDVNFQPCWNQDEEFTFVPDTKIIHNEEQLQNISQIHRVVFFGVCCYLEKCVNGASFNKYRFQDWMRFRNSDIQTVDSMREVIQTLCNKRHNSHNIIYFLQNNATRILNPQSYRLRQWNEEIMKAEAFPQKKEEILAAEKEFHGSIRFLLKKDNSLLTSDIIKKAKNLIENKSWFLDILPYMKSDIDDKEVISFTNKQDDVVKAINYNDKIITAVQDYLLDTTKCKQFNKTESWIYPLVTIKDAEHSLMDYSTTKRVRKYFWWNNDNPTGIYLYKGSQWKKDDCILLASDDSDLQNMIKKRNAFIKKQLEDNWKLCIEDENLKKEKISPIDEYKHYGRAIVLKNGNQLCYCAVDGYYENSSDTLSHYS